MRWLALLCVLLAGCSFGAEVDSPPLGDGPGDGDREVETDPVPEATPDPVILPFETKGRARRTSRLGGDDGTDFEEDCPEGEFIVGFEGAIPMDDGGLTRFRALCAQVTLVDDLMVVTPNGSTGAYGVSQALLQEPLICPAGSVVTAFAGTTNGDDPDDGAVHSLEITCRSLSWDGGDYAFGDEVIVGELGAPGEQGSNLLDCGGNKIAVGIDGRVESALGRLELRCFDMRLSDQL